MAGRAVVKVAVRGWTGWTREQPAEKSVELVLEAGQKLTPAIVGIESFPYELLVDWVGADRIMMAYWGMVIRNPGGTINFFAPTKGRCLIKTGCRLELASATTDAGTSVDVTLQRVE